MQPDRGTQESYDIRKHTVEIEKAAFPLSAPVPLSVDAERRSSSLGVSDHAKRWTTMKKKEDPWKQVSILQTMLSIF